MYVHMSKNIHTHAHDYMYIYYSSNDLHVHLYCNLGFGGVWGGGGIFKSRDLLLMILKDMNVWDF